MQPWSLRLQSPAPYKGTETIHRQCKSGLKKRLAAWDVYTYSTCTLLRSKEQHQVAWHHFSHSMLVQCVRIKESTVKSNVRRTVIVFLLLLWSVQWVVERAKESGFGSISLVFAAPNIELDALFIAVHKVQSLYF